MNTHTTINHRRRLRRGAVPVATAAVLILTGCGGNGSAGSYSSSSGTGSTGTSSTGTSDTTVAVHDVSGHTGVLATKDGRTLYVSDQEDGTVLCKSSACTAIWLPLTVGAGQKPTGPSGLDGTLSTVKRPDGKAQVALDGKPLYTFSFDHGSGETGGDGQKDSFDGTAFTWQLATAGGTSEKAPSNPAPSTVGGYGY